MILPLPVDLPMVTSYASHTSAIGYLAATNVFNRGCSESSAIWFKSSVDDQTMNHTASTSWREDGCNSFINKVEARRIDRNKLCARSGEVPYFGEHVASHGIDGLIVR